jgi:hypothetical protein
MHNRQQAALEGESCYQGKPCRNCGEQLRYTINATCVQCARKRSSELTKRRREEIKEMLSSAKGDI